MNDEQFSQLVSAYLDREISAEELHLLEQELAVNDVRSERFKQEKRINMALSIAFETGAVTLAGEQVSQPRKKAENDEIRRPAEVIYMDTQTGDIRFTDRGSNTASKQKKQPWWSYLGAAAACFVIGAFTLMPLVQQDQFTADTSNALVGVDQVNSLGGDPVALNPGNDKRAETRRVNLRPLTALMIQPDITVFADSVELMPSTASSEQFFRKEQQPLIQQGYEVHHVNYKGDLLPAAPIRKTYFGSRNPYVDNFEVQMTSGEIVR